MNQEVLNQITQKALEYVNSAEAFLSKEVPIYVQELLQFKIVEHLTEGVMDSLTFTMLIGTIMFTFSIAFFFEVIYNKDENSILKSILISLLVYPLFFTIGLALNHNDFIKAYKAYKAPRVYLIEYFKDSK